MAEIVAYDNDQKVPVSINDSGNSLVSSLKTDIPSADDSTCEDGGGKVQSCTVDLKEVPLSPQVKQDDTHHSSEASHMGKTLALTSIGENINRENQLNGTHDRMGEVCSEEDKSNERQAVVDGPVKARNAEKTLRLGWLDKAAGSTKYRKVAKPRGGVKKLKLDATACYSACQIRRLAIEAFEASSDHRPDCAIEQEYAVNLGDFGGQVISDFKRRDGQVCDIWDYCKDRGKTLYQLNLFMLTSPIDEEHEERSNERRTISTRRTKTRPRIVDDVRVLYQYVRRSAYSSELSYMECEKPELYSRLFEDLCGVCPAIERFEPSEYGFSISRIVKSGQVLLQISIDDSGARSTEFPESRSSLEEHGVLYDVDQLHGYCNRKFGIGFVPSCSYACRPTFSWYRDGELFKSHEHLYWLDDVKDDQTHLWSCTVVCAASGRQLKSKRVSIDGSLDTGVFIT